MIGIARITLKAPTSDEFRGKRDQQIPTKNTNKHDFGQLYMLPESSVSRMSFRKPEYCFAPALACQQNRRVVLFYTVIDRISGPFFETGSPTYCPNNTWINYPDDGVIPSVGNKQGFQARKIITTQLGFLPDASHPMVDM